MSGDLELDIFCVAVPFVGTLNDNEASTPVSFVENKSMQWKLEETPAIKCRKERMRHYLRYLPVRFEKEDLLFLSVYFATKNKRNIDTTNVLDLVQNAGNNFIWSDDRQFIYTQCQRYMIDALIKGVEDEVTIIYVASIPNEHAYDPCFRDHLHMKVTKDFKAICFDLRFPLRCWSEVFEKCIGRFGHILDDLSR
jgi:hypothetical protein